MGGTHGEGPLPHDPRTLPSNAFRAGPSVRGKGERPAARLRLQYVKRHPASYLSHLETLTLFHRALRRSKLPIHYTGGEHPHPKMAFSPALPVGVESLAEYLDLWLSRMPEAGEVEKGLNAVLPEGISVRDARPVPLNASSLEQSIAWMEYDITFPEATPQTPSQEDLKRAMEAFYDDEPVLCRGGRQGREEKRGSSASREAGGQAGWAWPGLQDPPTLGIHCVRHAGPASPLPHIEQEWTATSHHQDRRRLASTLSPGPWFEKETPS